MVSFSVLFKRLAFLLLLDIFRVMASKVLFVVYDNGSYDNQFPMGVGALSAVLKKQGHEIKIWNQDIHHYPDSDLTDYLDKNKIDISFILSSSLNIILSIPDTEHVQSFCYGKN